MTSNFRKCKKVCRDHYSYRGYDIVRNREYYSASWSLIDKSGAYICDDRTISGVVSLIDAREKRKDTVDYFRAIAEEGANHG